MADGETREERSAPWRENVEAMAMAVIMALLLKLFIVEAYQIPSGSMQPTLIGHEAGADTIKDRILADKLSFKLRDPERFEVVVFRFPLNRSKNFIKRIVGMPGEYFRIWNGDLWRRAEEAEPWEILRRPRDVQDDTWKRLVREEPEASAWLALNGDWTTTGRRIAARGTGEAEFRPDRGSIMDAYNDGYPDAILPIIPRVHQDSGIHPVGDLRLELEVEALEGCVGLVLELGEGPKRYVFRIPGPAASPGEVPSITVESRLLAAGPTDAAGALETYRLPAGTAVRVAVQNLDDLLELEIDGEVVAVLEVEAETDQSSSARIRLEGEGADLDEVMLFRDIYYTADHAKVSSIRIPEGMYFMLGDNTQNSSDSREWTFARYEVTDSETGEKRILRGSHERNNQNPYIDAGHPEGPILWLRDEWGERHRLLQSETRKLGYETSPFVPRELILGRAFAVFWPLDPLDGIYRWGWVH